MSTIAHTILISHMHSTNHIAYEYDTGSHGSVQQSTHETG